MPGFEKDAPGKEVMVGFARNAVMGVAPTVIEAVKNKAIRHFLPGGRLRRCQTGPRLLHRIRRKGARGLRGPDPGLRQVPFLRQRSGRHRRHSRLLDVGQCNDAYSAIQIAVALAGAFECGVNDLPLSMILSWYEQKACVILLSLLHLGIKDIRLGPSLPAFITPNVLNVLVENFNIMPIGTPDEDLKAILG
jgi:hydroxylamine reductase